MSHINEIRHNFHIQIARRYELQMKKINFQKSYGQEVRNFSGKDLRRKSFLGKTLEDVTFENCRLQGADFTDATLIRVKFRNSYLKKASFKEANLSEVSFQNTNLKDVCFDNAHLSNIQFGLATVQAKSFTNATLENVSFERPTNQLPESAHRYTSLISRNFREAKLSGSNFNYTLLQGTIFDDADLSRATFIGAKTGLRSRWFWLLSLVLQPLFIGLLILNTFAGLWGYDLIASQYSENLPQNILIYTLLFDIGSLAFFITLISKNLTWALWALGLSTISILAFQFGGPIGNLVTIALAGTVLTISMKTSPLKTIFGLIGLLLLEFMMISIYKGNEYNELAKYWIVGEISFVFCTLSTAAMISANYLMVSWLRRWLVILWSMIFPLFLYGILTLFFTGEVLFLFVENVWKVLVGKEFEIKQLLEQFFAIFEIIIFFVWGWLGVGLGIFIGWKFLADDSRYGALRNLVVFYGRWGLRSTQFKNANLAHANFSKAIVQNADFRGANLSHVCWKGCRKLNLSRFGQHYLGYARIRRLVTAPEQFLKNPANRNFDGLDLSGIDLGRANLAGASFVGSNLSHADLSYADLSHSQLIETNMDGANLEGANLNDICIENWKLTSNTKFGVDINCDAISLRRPTPGNPDPLRKEVKDSGVTRKELREKYFEVHDDLGLQELFDRFAEIALIKDKVVREYRLQLAAQNHEKIESDIYLQMFQDYLTRQKEAERRQSWWQSWLWFKVEPYFEKVNALTKELDIFPLLENLGRLSILIGVVLFFNDYFSQRLESSYRTWEVINSGDKNHGGVVVALRNWNRHSNLYGIEAKKVNLENINLDRAELGGANFQGSDLTNASLKGVNLRGANLQNATLKDADLGPIWSVGIPSLITSKLSRNSNGTSSNLVNRSGADSSKTDFLGADLGKADLSGAKLNRADLSRAKLSGAKLSGANLSGADLSALSVKSSQNQ